MKAILRPDEANWLTVLLLMLAVPIGIHHAASMAPFLNEMGDDLGVSDATMGQLGTVTFAGAAIAALSIAPFVPRYQLRGILWVSITVVGVMSLLTAISPSFGVMLPIRIVAGIAGGPVFAGAIAAVGRAWPDPGARRARQGFIIGAAAGGPGILAPLLRVIGKDGNWELSMAVFGIFCLGVALAVFIGLPKLAGKPDPSASVRREFLNAATVIFMPVIGLALGLRVVGNMIMVGTFVFMAGFYDFEFVGSDAWIGPAFAAASAGFMVSAFTFGRTLRATGGPANATYIGLIATAGVAVMFAWVTVSPALSTAIMFLFGVAAGVFFNGLVALLYEYSGDRQATTVFMDGALGPAGGAIGAALGGIAVGAATGYEGWKIYTTAISLGMLLPLLLLMRSVRQVGAAARL